MRFEVSLALNALIVFVEVTALFMFLNGFLDKRATTKTPVIGLYGAYFVCALISSQFIGNMLVNTIVSVMFPLAIALTLYHGGVWSRIVAAGLSIAYHFIVEPLAAMLIKLISGGVVVFIRQILPFTQIFCYSRKPPCIILGGIL